MTLGRSGPIPARGGVPGGAARPPAGPAERARARPDSDRRYLPVAGRDGMPARLARSALVLAWLATLAVATAAAATSIVSVDAPGWVARTGGGVVVVVFTLALSHRVGARTWLWTLLAAAGTAAGLGLGQAWSVSGVSVAAGVVSGVVAVLLTRPAVGAARSLVELVVALLVSSAGAVAVAGIDAPVRPERYSVVVAGVALALAIGLVWQLGTGLHRLGRRGLAVIVGGAVLAVALLIYAQVLRAYGSPVVLGPVDDTVAWLRDNLHGVPRPVQALLGFPALVWGVGVRASRRRGWWLCAFGVLGTATLAATLAAPQLDPQLAAVSAAYSAAIGAVLGLLARWVDRAVTGRSGSAGGRRARPSRAMRLARPEPGRTRPLA